MPVLATQPKHNYAGIIGPPLDDGWPPFPENPARSKSRADPCLRSSLSTAGP